MRDALVSALALCLTAVPAARADGAPVPCSERLASLADHALVLGVSAFDSSLDLLTQTVDVPPEQWKTIATVAVGFANALQGGNQVSRFVLETLAGVPAPVLALNVDPCDALLSADGGACGPEAAPGPHPTFAGSAGPTLNEVLSDEQEALLGCGPLWAGDCEASGIELADARPEALLQSWVGFDGSCVSGEGLEDWHLANGEPQPGTVGFAHPVLAPEPGLRGPFLADGVTPDPAYDPNRDGSVDGLVMPAEFGASAGQPFASEMAAVSFNFQLTLVVLSSAAGPPARDELDPDRPHAFYDPGDPSTLGDRRRCSFLQPQHCRLVKLVLAPEPAAALQPLAACASLVWLAARRRRAPPARIAG